MREEVFFSLDLPYRANGEIKAYVFGEGEKSLCIVGSTRGNEIQRTYLAAQMAHRLKKLEEKVAWYQATRSW